MMAGQMHYPRRPPFFAHRFVRALQQSCAAQIIGSASCFLLCVIAHTEDAGHYRGPARFWNAQLMEILGFRSPKQLEDARSRAIEAGWLIYCRSGGNRRVGQYFVTIPEPCLHFDDTSVEAIHSAGGMNVGTNPGMNTGEFIPPAEQERNGSPNDNETESGKPSNPFPNPVPLPSNTQSKSRPKCKSYRTEFEQFYAAYPRKEAKGQAAKAYDKILPALAADKAMTESQAAEWLLQVTIKYAASPAGQQGQYTPYPATWLNRGSYDEDPLQWRRSNGSAQQRLLATGAGQCFDPIRGGNQDFGKM